METFGITLTSKSLGFSAEQYHFTCTLRRGESRFETEFHMGSAHKGRDPKLLELLVSVQLDARAGDNTFEDYCWEFGENEDSRKAERIWKECAKLRAQLQEFLGDDFEAFMSTDFEGDGYTAEVEAS